jgi:hypothetical protein
MRTHPRLGLSLGWCLCCAASSGVASGALAASLTGVCPDGSVYVVQRADAIPCKGARAVEPHQVPPLRPEYLPRPYTWHVYNETANPNNPYHLVEAAKQIRGLGAVSIPPPMAGEAARSVPPGGAPFDPGPAGESSYAGRGGGLDLALSEGELHDLFMIVELSQRRVPAAFRKERADGRRTLEVSFAHSDSFESRFLDAWRAAGHPGDRRILLWSAIAKDLEPFHASFTFTQGHQAFQPKPGDPTQLGVLQGQLGELVPDEVVLGYVVLPANVDLASPLDVYWDDRHQEITFWPQG